MLPKKPLGEPPGSLVTALKNLLRPLIRLLLAHGITYPFLSNLLKSIFVEVAENDFTVEGKQQTDSRIHLLTGVHRKDVRKIRNEDDEEQIVPKAVSLGSQIVSHWVGDPDYLDKKGKPVSLYRLASTGEPSFETLVESVGKQDIRARAVLDEWLRLGVVKLDDQDKVHLNVSAFIPEKGFDEKAFYFGINLRDHVAAGTHNLLGEEPPFFDRSVHYSGLTQESVEKVKELAVSLGDEALIKVNKKAMALKKADAKCKAADQRINFGIFYYSGDKMKKIKNPNTN